MKLILVPILAMLILTQTFSKWLVVLEYNLNKDYIAQTLCVNKAKPKLNCHGKCQMMKRLVEEEKQNSSSTTNHPSKIQIQEVLYSNETVQLTIPLLISSASSYNEESPIFLHKVPAPSIFHPPAVG
ncbi:MAG TPA: hypothetical protein VL095_07740 [Flavisolibacter sp.]|nr:hypothetical protein [Flavisolibacter sp.]